MTNPDRIWHSAAPNLTISNTDIHIWRVNLDRPAAEIENLALTLSDSELHRAERFHFARDKNSFIVARGALRAILSRYLNVAPKLVQFSYGPCGKPEIAAHFDSTLCFNLSHSQGLALYAVTRGRKIGADIEQIRPVPNMESIAERFFSQQENAAFKAVSAEQKLAAFFNCWTRKEAYIKAIGDGLSFPLDRFSVSLTPGEPAQLLNVAGEGTAPNLWYLKALVPAPNYIAAIAVEALGELLISQYLLQQD
ncbi:4'-phosphopantetheinyl transferase superfamily protein [Microcoleus sp. herbarium7]|uniref:4'-phosphopantetheinyl transferase family protein n=1 Tax=Microcoleus sp. herbarium7 TaxID=3055435 RepID=UPI002FCFD463